MKVTTSIKIYLGLIVTLTALSAIGVLLPQGGFLPTPELPAPRPVLALLNAAVVLVLYGGLGFAGLKISQRLGFPDLWDPRVSNSQRFLTPALIGVGIGVFFVLVDMVLSQLHPLGRLPHPPFPTSLVASVAAGIGEEIIFRLFFISFWVWLISYVILKKRWQNRIFWIVAVLSAIAFAFGHIPSVMLLLGLKTIDQIPLALMSEIVLLNGVLSLFAAYYFKKSGFLASVGIHFWADVVWHIIWGLF